MPVAGVIDACNSERRPVLIVRHSVTPGEVDHGDVDKSSVRFCLTDDDRLSQDGRNDPALGPPSEADAESRFEPTTAFPSLVRRNVGRRIVTEMNN